MKKINLNGIRALILETLEEMSLGEAKKEEVKEDLPTAVPGKDDVGTGTTSSEPDEGDNMMNAMSTTEVQKVYSSIKSAFDYYEQEPSPERGQLIVSIVEKQLEFLQRIFPEPETEIK